MRHLFLCALFLLGCSDATQITVRVFHDAVPATANLEIRSWRNPASIERRSKVGPTFPESLAIVPRAGELGTVHAEAVLTNGAQTLMVEGSATFREGENVYLDLRFVPEMNDGGIAEDAGSDGGIIAPDADGGIAEDAGITDAGSIDAGVPSSCPPLRDGDGREIDATHIAALPGAHNELLAVSGSVGGEGHRYLFRRAPSARCFELLIPSIPGDIQRHHLNRNGNSNAAITSQSGGTTRFSEIPNIATTPRHGMLSPPIHNGNSAVVGATTSSEKPHYLLVNQDIMGSPTNNLRIVARTGTSWDDVGTFFNATAIDALGSEALVFRRAEVELWDIVDWEEPVTPDTNTETVIRWTDEAPVAGALIGPGVAVLARGFADSLMMCTRTRDWDCDRIGIDGRTLTNLTRDQLDGGQGCWAVLGHASSRTLLAFHSVQGEGISAIPLPGATTETPIATLSDGVAYIDATKKVRFALRSSGE